MQQGVSCWNTFFFFQADFEKIAADVKQVKSRPSDQELLDLYGLYKQAIAGDINIGNAT